MDNPRQQRGMQIAATGKIERNGDRMWLVPSQTTVGVRYAVFQHEGEQRCSCPDHQDRGVRCKHMFAVEIVIQRELFADGTETVTKKVTVAEVVQRKPSYPQNWPAYNRAQGSEKNRLQVLLSDLCRNLPEPERDPSRRGPKPHSVKDSVFAMVYKVYCGFSARRFSCDLQDAFDNGHTSRAIPGMKVTAFFENPAFTPILAKLIPQSAAPLACVETEFAVDSTGFSTSRFERWYDEKYGVTRQKNVWVKCHACTGVKTNCITAVRIMDKESADCPQFNELVTETAKRFKIGEVSADKAYASYDNFETVDNLGGTAFMSFKAGTKARDGGVFAKMFHYFQFKQEEYLSHYHKRSNVESTFSAVKRKFGDAVMSKTDTAMYNEVLCKLICQNLTCLIQEQETLGVVPMFWKDEAQTDCNVIRMSATQFGLKS